MWRVKTVFILVLLISFAGCKMFEVESPRPLEYQTDAAVEVFSDDKVTTVVGAQTDKQERIKEVAIAAFVALGAEKEGTGDEEEIVTSIEGVTEEVAEVISNIAANAFSAIQYADGTTNVLGNVMRKTNKDILTMNVLEYAAYAASQGAVAGANKEKLYKGIETVKGLATSTLGIIAGGALGGGGLITFALRALGLARRRGTLLRKTGVGIEKFAAEKPLEGALLKNELAKSAASLPINAKKEFDV